MLALQRRTELEEQFLMAHYQKKLLRLGWAVPKRHMVLERKISSCMDHLSNTLYYFYSVLKLSDTKGITVLKAFASMLLFSVFQMPWAWKHEIKKTTHQAMTALFQR